MLYSLVGCIRTHVSSVNWLLLLSAPESKKSATSDLNNLESDSWNITLGVTRSTETSNEALVVLLNEGHTTISWDVGGDSLVVLLKLNSNALSNTGVRLLGLYGNLFNDDSSGVRSILEWLLPLGTGVLLLVSEIGPPIMSQKLKVILTIEVFCEL